MTTEYAHPIYITTNELTSLFPEGLCQNVWTKITAFGKVMDTPVRGWAKVRGGYELIVDNRKGQVNYKSVRGEYNSLRLQGYVSIDSQPIEKYW